MRRHLKYFIFFKSNWKSILDNWLKLRKNDSLLSSLCSLQNSYSGGFSLNEVTWVKFGLTASVFWDAKCWGEHKFHPAPTWVSLFCWYFSSVSASTAQQSSFLKWNIQGCIQSFLISAPKLILRVCLASATFISEAAHVFVVSVFEEINFRFRFEVCNRLK